MAMTKQMMRDDSDVDDDDGVDDYCLQRLMASRQM